MFTKRIVTLSVLTLGALALFFQPLMAQNQGKMKQRQAGYGIAAKGTFGGGMKAGACGHLNLSAEQKAQVAEIWKSHKDEIQAVRNNTALTPEQKRARMQEIRNVIHSEIAQVLTPEQRAQFEEKRGKMGKSRERMRQDLQGALRQLNLTEDQKTRIRQILESYKPQFQALRNDTTLTPEQKQTRSQELRQASKADVLQVLTPEQRQKLDKMTTTAKERWKNRQGPGTGQNRLGAGPMNRAGGPRI